MTVNIFCHQHPKRRQFSDPILTLDWPSKSQSLTISQLWSYNLNEFKNFVVINQFPFDTIHPFNSFCIFSDYQLKIGAITSFLSCCTKDLNRSIIFELSFSSCLEDRRGVLTVIWSRSKNGTEIHLRSYHQNRKESI